jgi:hypothetical protein
VNKIFSKGDSDSYLIQYINGRVHTIGIASFIGSDGKRRYNPTTACTQVSKYIETASEKNG